MVDDTRESHDAEVFAHLAESISQMARRSPRAQAALVAALNRTGIDLVASERQRYLDMLIEAGLVENVIILNDGEVLMTVTARGMKA